MIAGPVTSHPSPQFPISEVPGSVRPEILQTTQSYHLYNRPDPQFWFDAASPDHFLDVSSEIVQLCSARSNTVYGEDILNYGGPVMPKEPDLDPLGEGT
ncbi:hypothetical protein RRG08_047119 [Elysia crispata]|uniref:Uncharacterized protein n=1 Tax=Elysia crispata TaxID=231223 RepID=A0AAE1AQ16_9GAST|nr:hypothetical protein RRG08_047119 [Elysia crispata]